MRFTVDGLQLMWYFMFGQVALRSGQVDFLSTCPAGQVGF